MVTALDASGYASREDRNLVMVGGGDLSWTLSTSTLVWTADIQILSTVTGHVLTAAATSLTLDDGEIVYVNLVRSPTDSSSRTPQVASQIPSSDNAFLLAMRVGNNVYFRNGQRIADGETLSGLGTGPTTSGGGLNTQGVGEWKFDADITDSDPGSGKWKLNHADETAAAFIYMNDANNGGLDASKLIQLLALNSLVYIQRTEDSNEALLYEVTGDPTDGGGYWKIPVSYESEHTAGWVGAANKKYAFLFGTTGGAGGGGGGGGLGQWDYATGGGAPAATKITANFDLMSSTTIINIADGSGTDNNFSAAFGAVRAGDYLVLKDSAGGAAYGTFLVAAAPVDNTTYWTFTVSTGNVSGSFTDTNTYDFNIISDGNVVGPGTVGNRYVVVWDGTTGKLVKAALDMSYGGLGIQSLSLAGGAADAAIFGRGTGPSLTAGYGKYWVKLVTPNLPMCTDDTGTEHALYTGVKEKVRAATTAAGTLTTDFENLDVIDGVTLATGDRILIKTQATAAENGIYIVEASGTPTRATDLPIGALASAITMRVLEGTVNANSEWQCTNLPAADVVNTNNLVFLEIFAPDRKYVAGHATAPATPASGDGVYWVDTPGATDSTPMFTDDAGAAEPVALLTGASLPNNYIPVGANNTDDGRLKNSVLKYTSGELHNNNSTASSRMNERTTGPTGVAAGGWFWVKDDAPTRPKFTDDTDVEHYLDRPTPTVLATNELVDIDATEVVIGGGYLDGSTGGIYSWEILATYNDNGGTGNQDLDILLYDRGPDGTPVAGVLRSTLTITSLDTLDRVTLTLAGVSSPGTDTDEIDSDEPRLYEIRAKLDAGGAVDTAKILSVKFVES